MGRKRTTYKDIDEVLSLLTTTAREAGVLPRSKMLVIEHGSSTNGRPYRLWQSDANFEGRPTGGYYGTCFAPSAIGRTAGEAVDTLYTLINALGGVVMAGKEAPAAAAENALDAIHAELDGIEWSPDTLDRIAYIVESTGRALRDPNIDDDLEQAADDAGWDG